MPGPRQPTDLEKANGRKHLTEAEADARRDQEVYVPPPDAAVPPRWLPKRICTCGTSRSITWTSRPANKSKRCC